jgi:serine/threonine-protein kinase
MTFETGQRVGDYEVLGVLGAGGMGQVYRVRNLISDRVEAMKVLLPDLSAEPELANRFIGEIRTLASFDHPNIAQLHTAFQVDNRLVMIMEYIEGFTLDQRAKQSAMPLNEVLDYITQVLSALSYAHGRGVIHRDIKPGNMMVTPHGVLKLMDFGIAKSTADPHLTRPGTTMGSLYYMSPEQVRGTTVDARSDIYSVGISLYELSAGKRPFEADSTFGILNHQLNSVPQPPKELNPSLPPALNEIILAALAKEPMQRFQTADAFRNALQSVRSSLAPDQARTETAPARNPVRDVQPNLRPAKSHRALWMTLGALAVVAVLVAAAIFVPRWSRTRADVESQVQPDKPAVTTSAAPVATAPSASAPPASVHADIPRNRSDNRPEPSQTVRMQESQAAPVARQPRITHAVEPPPVQTSPVQTPQAANTPAQVSPAQTPPASSKVSGEELEALNNRMIQLGARANAAKASIDQLRQEQAAGGFGLRQDVASSLSRMEAYMDAAERAIQGENAQAARKSMDQAEKEIDNLEAFLGR